MLKIDNVEVVYSSVILVLRGISLEVGDKAMVALLGANGAGKTTLLKAISGLLGIELGKVTEGRITFDGKRLLGSNPEDVVHKVGITQVLEGRRILEHLTAEENIKAGAVASGAGLKRDLDKMYYYFPRLKDVRNRTGGYCSGGEQQMIVVARALMTHPTLMLVDEASLGLSPLLVKEIFEIMRTINTEEGTAVLLVEQNARAALDLVKYGYVMEMGRIVLDGPAAELRNNEDIKEFYLGLSEVGKRKSYRDAKHYKRRKRWLG